MSIFLSTRIVTFYNCSSMTSFMYIFTEVFHFSVSQTCFPRCQPTEYCGNSTEGGGPVCLGVYVYSLFIAYKSQPNTYHEVIKRDLSGYNTPKNAALCARQIYLNPGECTFRHKNGFILKVTHNILLK